MPVTELQIAATKRHSLLASFTISPQTNHRAVPRISSHDLRRPTLVAPARQRFEQNRLSGREDAKATPQASHGRESGANVERALSRGCLRAITVARRLESAATKPALGCNSGATKTASGSSAPQARPVRRVLRCGERHHPAAPTARPQRRRFARQRTTTYHGPITSAAAQVRISGSFVRPILLASGRLRRPRILPPTGRAPRSRHRDLPVAVNRTRSRRRSSSASRPSSSSSNPGCAGIRRAVGKTTA